MDSVHVHRTKDGKETGRTVIREDESGREVARFGYDGSGREIYHSDVMYEETDLGLVKTGFTYKPDGSLWQKWVGRFDKDGELLESISWDSELRVIDRQVYSYTETEIHYEHYDSTGQMIESWTKRMQPGSAPAIRANSGVGR